MKKCPCGKKATIFGVCSSECASIYLDGSNRSKIKITSFSIGDNVIATGGSGRLESFKKLKKGMKVKIIFSDEWASKVDEKERIVKNITEIHYCYESPLEPSTAFESEIDCTGFTMPNRYIKEFEAIMED
jgi:hypothetical protein